MLRQFPPMFRRQAILKSASLLLVSVLSQPSILEAQTQTPTMPQLKADETMRSLVQECLNIDADRDESDTSHVQLGIQVNKPPVGMAFDVTLQLPHRSLPIGPVAWCTDNDWWAFDIDVPADMKKVRILLTPSAVAAARLKRLHPTRLAELESIWDGEPIVKTVKVSTQRLVGMMRVEPPAGEAAHEEQARLLVGNDPASQTYKQDGNLEVASRSLERALQESPENSQYWFNLGCLRIIAADYRNAIECFKTVLKIKPTSLLADAAQLQLRRIGGYLMHLADHGAGEEARSNAMCNLGLMYRHGWGPKENRQVSKRWLRSAARAGNVQAMFDLGEMYEQDSAANSDDLKRQKWFDQQAAKMYRDAAARGHTKAAEWVAAHDQQKPVTPLIKPKRRVKRLTVVKKRPSTIRPVFKTSIDVAMRRSQYSDWVQSHSETSLDNHLMVITRVGGEEEVKARNDQYFPSRVSYARSYVSLDGKTSSSYHDSFGTDELDSRGSVAADDLPRLKELLASLPDDQSTLPPAHRRILVQAMQDGKWVARVYDRGAASDEVLEILRLSDSEVGCWFPVFESRNLLKVAQFGGFFRLAPDQSQMMFSHSNKLQFYDVSTREPLGEIKANYSLEEIAFNPDNSLAVLGTSSDCEVVEVTTWKRIKFFSEPIIDRRVNALSNARFTPDGKYLVMQSSEPALHTYDTDTWKRVDRLPGIPAETVQYTPAARKPIAIIATKGGPVMLWDLHREASIAELDRKCFVVSAVFNPDESLVAVATKLTIPADSYHSSRLRIWNAETGQLQHELRSLEIGSLWKAQHLTWSPDGEYLIAAIESQYSAAPIAVWNARTGRHRGGLHGGRGDMLGMALLPDQSEIIACATDGDIHFWDFPSVMEQIRTFENSVEGRTE